MLDVADADADWMTGLLSPLISRLGDRLVVCRDGNRVQWQYEGDSAIVQRRSGAALDATFVASSATAGAVYRSGSTYTMTPGGCTRMVADMLAFFSGTREPRFRFVGLISR